jgi:flagellar export protein FliJ
MKAFKFNLERVLVVREREEDVALTLLARSEKHLQGMFADKHKVFAKLQKLQANFKDLQLASPIDFELLELAIQGCKVQLERSEQLIFKAHKEVGKARELFFLRKKRTKTILHLKEKALARYKLERQKHEAKELDDMMIMRFKGKETSNAS